MGGEELKWHQLANVPAKYFIFFIPSTTKMNNKIKYFFLEEVTVDQCINAVFFHLKITTNNKQNKP